MNRTPETERTKLSWKNQFPEVEKGSATLFGNVKILQKLCLKTVRTPRSFLRSAKMCRKRPCIEGIGSTI